METQDPFRIFRQMKKVMDEGKLKEEIAFHLEAYFDGDINGDDLANAIEEVLFAHS